jgi:hypothetical protein
MNEDRQEVVGAATFVQLFQSAEDCVLGEEEEGRGGGERRRGEEEGRGGGERRRGEEGRGEVKW